MSVNAGAFAGTLAMAVALLVAGCDKERCEPASQTARAPDQSADVRKAAENSVRFSASNPDSVRFRGVQVWPQAIKNQFAVCGQANVFGASSNTYLLFVVVVTRNDIGDDPAGIFIAQARVGSTVTEATKVYVDTLVRCYESGGPQNIMHGRPAPVPPMPSETDTILSGPTPATTGAAPAARPQPSAMVQAPATHASGTVVMRQNGNIRTAPQGETIRVEPQGKDCECSGRHLADGSRSVTPRWLGAQQPCPAPLRRRQVTRSNTREGRDLMSVSGLGASGEDVRSQGLCP